MSLPIFNTTDRILSMLQTQWASVLDVLLNNPSLQSQLLKNITLANGATVINHKLSRNMQGWRIVDISSPATVYRSAPLNDKTLTLTSDAATVIALEVF